MIAIYIKIVKCDDWEVLYINGEKKYEGHEIIVGSRLFDCINLSIGDGITKIDFDDLWVTDEYMGDVGCPDKFSDIPDDVIIS